MAINKAAIHSIYQAASFTEELRIAYQQLKQIQAKINLYGAGTDPIFNAAINAAIGAPERAEIAAMKGDIDTLLAAWEAAHGGIISPV